MKNKKLKTLKKFIVILIIIAVVLGIIIYNYIKNEEKNKITIDNLPQPVYTEDEAKEFYTKKLINYLDTFQGDFHIKYTVDTVNEKGEKVTANEEFSKRGGLTSLYNEEENYRLIEEDKYFYSIDDNGGYAYKFPKSEPLSFNMDVLFYSLKSINSAFVQSGNELLDIDGQTYYYEEYKMEKDNSVLVRYYFDTEGNMKYIKAYKEDSKLESFFKIHMLENTTYDFMFEISDEYEYLDLTTQQ